MRFSFGSTNELFFAGKNKMFDLTITLDNFFSRGYIFTFNNARSSAIESTMHTEDNRSCINAGSGNLYLYTFSNIIHFLSSKAPNAGRSIYYHLGGNNSNIRHHVHLYN